MVYLCNLCVTAPLLVSSLTLHNRRELTIESQDNLPTLYPCSSQILMLEESWPFVVLCSRHSKLRARMLLRSPHNPSQMPSYPAVIFSFSSLPLSLTYTHTIDSWSTQVAYFVHTIEKKKKQWFHWCDLLGKKALYTMEAWRKLLKRELSSCAC